MSATLRSRMRVGGDAPPAVAVGGLVRAGVEDQRLERVLDDLLGQRPRRVVRARGRPGRRLDDDQAAGLHDDGPVAQVAADHPDDRPQPVAERRRRG